MKSGFNDQKSFIAYNDFSGGINTDCGEDGYAKNELTKATNIDIISNRKIQTRAGIVPLNSTSYGAEVRKYFEWRQKSGEVLAVAVFKHSDPVSYTLEKIDLSTGVNTTIATIEGDDFDFEVFNDKLLFIVGGKYRYYDGTVLKYVRQSAPTGTLTIAQSTTFVPQYDEEGNLITEFPDNMMSGIYKFKFVTVNSIGAESPASSLTQFTASNCQQFTITVPVGDSDTVSRYIYRTIAGGSIYYLVGEISDNTTTTFYDSTIDSELSITLNDENIHTNLVKCTILKRHPHSMRFFAAGNPDDVSALYVSEPNEPWNWKETVVYYPNSGTGGKVLDIRMTGKFVVVFYESGPYTWAGVDPDVDATWGPLSIYQSPSGKGLSCLTSNTITFANGSGFHMINPSLFSATNILVQSSEEYITNLAKQKFTNEFKKIEHFENARMMFDWVDQKILLYCDDGNENYRVLVYWWNHQAFTIYTGWEVNEWFQSYDGTIKFASDNYIFVTKRGLNDNGAVIPFELETGAFDLGVDKIFKIISKMFFYCELSGGKTFLDVSVTSDIDSKTLNQIQLYSGTLWSSAYTWSSSSRWGQKSMVTKERRARIKGLKFKVNIKNSNLNEKIILNSIGFRFKATKPKGERN